MFMRLYNHKSAIVWAYRGKMTPTQIGKDPKLAPIMEQDTVLFDDGNGTVYDFRYLKDLKDAYGIEEEDPQAALELVIQAYFKPTKTPEELLADQQAQIDEQAAAIEELITMQLEGVE